MLSSYFRRRLAGSTTTRSGRVVLRERDRRAFAAGGPIPIGYVRSRPDESWAAGYEPDTFPLVLIPLVSIALLSGAAAITWGVRRQWVLLSEGRVAQARVTGQKKVHSDKHQASRVSYEFQTLSGSTQKGHYDVGKNPPPIGTIVPVVYHRETPRWSTAYPLQFVRPSRR